MRAYDVELNLNEAEYKLADAELDKGCSVSQAYSMRWGGVLAITADLAMYSEGVEAAKESGSNEPYIHGAAVYLALVLAIDPTEYQSFLRYINVELEPSNLAVK